MISITKRESEGLMHANANANTASVANVSISQVQARIMRHMQHWLLKVFVAFVALQMPDATMAKEMLTMTTNIATTTTTTTTATTTTTTTWPAIIANAVADITNEAYKGIKPTGIITTNATKTVTVLPVYASNVEKHKSQRANGNVTAGFIVAIPVTVTVPVVGPLEKLQNFTQNLSTTTTTTTTETLKPTKHEFIELPLNGSFDAGSMLNSTELNMSFHEYCLANRDSIPDLLTIVLYSIVCIIGLFGNTLVIYVVLRFSKMQTVTNIYILNLAIADECFLIGIPFLLYTMRICSWTFGEYMCKAYMVSTSITQFTSSIFLLIMSADRFIAVCHPIASPRYRTIRIAKFVSAVAWLTSAVLMLPVILFASTITQEDGIHHSCNIEWPEAYNKHTGTTFILYTFFLGFATPLCFILCFYYLVIKKLHAVGRKHKSKEKKRSHRKVTRLVLTVITVYVLCWLPQWISQVALINSSPDQNDLSRFQVLIFLLLGCLAYSNSAMNPILYAFLSDNFRKSFSKAFTCMAGHEVNAQLQVEPSVFTKHGGSRRRGSKRSIAQTVPKTKAKSNLLPVMPGNNNSSTTTSSTTTQAEKHTVAIAMSTGTGGTAQTTITTLTSSCGNAVKQFNDTVTSVQANRNGLINTEDIVLVLDKQESICATLAERRSSNYGTTLQTDL